MNDTRSSPLREHDGEPVRDSARAPRHETKAVGLAVIISCAALLLWGSALLVMLVIARWSTPVPEAYRLAEKFGVDPVALSNGHQVFASLCAVCHGASGQGMPHLGVALRANTFVQSQADGDLVRFITTGRPATDPANRSGIAMPARGGNPDLTHAQLEDVVVYLRTLQGVEAPSDERVVAVNLEGMGGEQMFAMLCVSCHGEKAQGNQLLAAPSLNGQYEWYLKRQLRNFNHGIRGTHPDDIRGSQMQAVAAQITTDDQLQQLAEYVASINGPRPAHTIAGDVVNGERIFGLCAVCHGDDARGRPDQRTPSLRVQDDWYLLAQLTKFKSGIRGSHFMDITAGPMRAVATTLPDEQTMRDVIAYISQLDETDVQE